MSDEEQSITSIPPPDTGEIEFGDELPVLPIRNAVLFPAAVAPFDVGREKSVALVEDIENLDQPIIAIMAQRDPSTDDPDPPEEAGGLRMRPPTPQLVAMRDSSSNHALHVDGFFANLEQPLGVRMPERTFDDLDAFGQLLDTRQHTARSRIFVELQFVFRLADVRDLARFPEPVLRLLHGWLGVLVIFVPVPGLAPFHFRLPAAGSHRPPGCILTSSAQ